jgi:hypothetical protein
MASVTSPAGINGLIGLGMRDDVSQCVTLYFTDMNTPCQGFLQKHSHGFLEG